jgi:tripartite-type tricarboxylate transporter receptor subunit TctC
VPEIPTIDESGVPGYDKGGWTGMFAPARVPDAIVDHVYQAVAKALKDPEAVRRLADDGLVAVASSPAEFTKFVADEIVEWTKLTHAMHLEKRSLKGG